MRRPGGYAVWFGGDGHTLESDSFTCAHCNKVVLVGHTADFSFVRPEQRTAPDPDIGGFCRLCMANVCGPCADFGKCIPFERKLEAIERGRSLRELLG